MKIDILRQKIGQGKERIVLAYDPPVASTVDGHMVDRENLDFELFEKPKNDREVKFNRMLMDRAEKIREHRYECINSGKIRLYRPMSELGFIDFYKRTYNDLKVTTNFTAGLACFREYTHDECPWSAVTKDLYVGYRDFLLTKTQREFGALNVNSVKGYFNQFRKMLRMAYAQGFIKEDLYECAEIIHEGPFSELYYVQKSQIHDLFVQDCSVPDIKMMCFFLLLTRFRIGEIKDLDWMDVIRLPNEKPFILKKLAGKDEKVRVFIQDEAMRFLGPPKKSGRVFRKMSYVYSRNRLREWVSKAGLPKELVTFESFRRGFDSIEQYL